MQYLPLTSRRSTFIRLSLANISKLHPVINAATRLMRGSSGLTIQLLLCGILFTQSKLNITRIGIIERTQIFHKLREEGEAGDKSVIRRLRRLREGRPRFAYEKQEPCTRRRYRSNSRKVIQRQ